MKEIEAAVAGRQYWLSNNLDYYDFVMVIPKDAEADRELFVCLLANKIAQTNGQGIMVSATDELEKEERRCKIKPCTDEEAQNLIYLYSMYEFTDKLIIASFKQPFGRSLENYMGYMALNKKKIASMALFKLEEEKGGS